MFNDSVKLKWKGEEYDCPITMNLAKDMEKGGCNILETAIALESGSIPPVTVVAELYSRILAAGGCEVTSEDVYISIMSDIKNSPALINSAKHAINLFFPRIETAERPSGKAKKP